MKLYWIRTVRLPIGKYLALIKLQKMIFVLPECLIHLIMEYIYVDDSIGRRWCIETLPIICKEMYKIVKKNVKQKKVKCTMLHNHCLVHRDEDFYRLNLGTFKFLQYYTSEAYNDNDSGDGEFVHFKTEEQTNTFISKYSHFFYIGNTCCSGYGVHISKI